MKTELIYLWIEKDTHECFHNMGFNFSSCYDVAYDSKQHELQIDKKESINVFREDNIANVTAIIGENGAGKTTLMNFLTTMNDAKEYDDGCISLKKETRFLAVFLERDEGRTTVANFTQRSIHVVDNNLFSNYICKPTPWERINQTDCGSHVFLSNNAYVSAANLGSRTDGIHHIFMTDSTVAMFKDDFYKGIYGISETRQHDFNKESRFSRLQTYYVVRQGVQSFQSLLDIIYYFWLEQKKQEFVGKQIQKISFSIVEAGKNVPYDDEYAQDELLEQGRKRAKDSQKDLQIENFYDVLVYNLVFELMVVYEGFDEWEVRNGGPTSDGVFERCISFVSRRPNDERKRYYEEAIEEIVEFGSIINGGKTAGKFNIRNLETPECYVTVDIDRFQKIIENVKEKHSFVLKYLRFWNLKMSSGERALLNMMSRLYFSAHITEFMMDKSFHWMDSILLMIDEIDLYLHPEWQRKIIKELLNQIKLNFPDKWFQIIITSHSPIVLSDIPTENSIFLQRDAHGYVCQVDRNVQTFGANIHTLYRDAFFLKNGLAMGEFAQDTINQWIVEYKAGRLEPEEMKKRLQLIGEPLIRKRLEKMLDLSVKQEQKAISGETKEQMIRFLERQKKEIEEQIAVLKEI